MITEKVFEVCEPKVQLDLGILEACSVDVNVRLLGREYDTFVLRQEKDAEKPMCAKEYFLLVERCENNGTYPCICVEEDVSSERAWFEEHDSKEYLSEVKYTVEDGKLIVTIE